MNAERLKIMEEFETIRAIIKQGASIARFGDGELRVAIDGASCSQHPDKRLAAKLRHILRTDVKGLFVGLPRVDRIPDWPQRYYANPAYMDLLNFDKQYYSIYITRPDAAPHIECPEYWNLCKSIWKGKKVVAVVGNPKPELGEYSKLLSDAAELNYTFGPWVDGFSEYDKIIEQICNKFQDKKTIIHLSLGAAATAMVYDLHKLGYQALDMGHWAAFCSGTHHKSSRWKKDE